MELQGTLTEIMESWPLQLAIEVAGASHHIELAPDAVVMQHGKRQQHKALKTGIWVTVVMDPSGSGARIARRVELQ